MPDFLTNLSLPKEWTRTIAVIVVVVGVSLAADEKADRVISIATEAKTEATAANAAAEEVAEALTEHASRIQSLEQAKAALDKNREREHDSEKQLRDKLEAVGNEITALKTAQELQFETLLEAIKRIDNKTDN